MKDDKTYPWICIKNDAFPRVFMTRNLIKDGSEYFGPYAYVQVCYALLELIRELYPIRTCNYDLNRKNIESGKYSVDRKSTRLNSSHVAISYAVFCLKKKR